jgi:hypothetical protein
MVDHFLSSNHLPALSGPIFSSGTLLAAGSKLTFDTLELPAEKAFFLFSRIKNLRKG